MQKIMEECVGIYRNGKDLERGAEELATLRERAENIALDDHSHTFNTELTAALELGYMMDASEAIIHSAKARHESRGSHQRTDYPERDDDKFLQHSLAYRTESDAPRIEYAPVSITRWPPGKRVYGK